MNRFFWLTWFLLLFLIIAFFTLPGKALAAAVMICLVAVYAGIVVYGALIPRANLFLRSVNDAPAAGKRVALTFDDGPNSKITPVLLDVLKAESIPAAFFYIGQAMAKRPDLVRRAEAEGHLLGNLGFTHSPYWGFFKVAGIRHEIEQTNQLFQEILGRTPRFFRPPYSVTRPGLQPVLKRLSMLCIGWSARGLEGRMPNSAAIVQRIMKRVRPGAIILLHECYFNQRDFTGDQVVETIRLLAKQLREAGYSLVRLDQLLGQKGYQG